MAHLYLCRTYLLMGREEEARAEAAEVRRIDPNFRIDRYAKGIVWRDAVDALKRRDCETLRKPFPAGTATGVSAVSSSELTPMSSSCAFGSIAKRR